jgi:hypothetical protein
MWNPFKKSPPTCPIDPDQQQWLDGRFEWLLEQFGHDAPANTQVILPTPEFFPDVYEGRPDDAQAMLNRICGYMNVNPSRLRLFLFESGHAPTPSAGVVQTSTAAGLYVPGQTHTDDPSSDDTRPPAQLGIDVAQLADPMALVATFAHEIGHEILLGQNRVSGDESDHEPLTDLLTVFLGLGIFTANSTIRDRAWSSGTWAGWSTRRLGYLDQRMFGYAHARFAHARNESNPPWASHIRPDVRAPMAQSLRYLADRA